MRRFMSVLLPLIVAGWAAEVVARDEMPANPAPVASMPRAETQDDTDVDSIVRVGCADTRVVGTAFKHKSGKFLATASVVGGCQDVVLFLRSGALAKGRLLAEDAYADLALIEPELAVAAPPFALSQQGVSAIRAPIECWGYPSGYDGPSALLSSGYVAGHNVGRTAAGKVVRRLVVNAGLSGGQSGSPLIDQSGKVVGVVSGRLTPLSGMSMAALRALQNQDNGEMYTVQGPYGATLKLSQGQIVAAVLHELQYQTQFTMGLVTPVEDVQAFLLVNGIDP